MSYRYAVLCRSVVAFSLSLELSLRVLRAFPRGGQQHTTTAATRRGGRTRLPRRRDEREELQSWSPTQNFSDIAKRRMCASTHCKVPIRNKQGGKNVNGYQHTFLMTFLTDKTGNNPAFNNIKLSVQASLFKRGFQLCVVFLFFLNDFLKEHQTSQHLIYLYVLTVLVAMNVMKTNHVLFAPKTNWTFSNLISKL